MAPPLADDPLVEHAGAKINLTLRILGRRPDFYHELESVVAFARVGDELRLTPGAALALDIRGPFAAGISAGPDNLVLAAARELFSQIDGLRLGRFTLRKRLPVASGIGGGSADAAAALRLLARVNALSPDDPRLLAAARAVGADVPVCLNPRTRLMRGIGEILSAPLALPPLPAVLVNPGVAVETGAVFAALARARAAAGADAARARSGAADADLFFAFSALVASLASPRPARAAFFDLLAPAANDLEPIAIALAPVIADVLGGLRSLAGCRLARMSGSGATCFALFTSARAAAAAARHIRTAQPAWWVQATVIG